MGEGEGLDEAKRVGEGVGMFCIHEMAHRSFCSEHKSKHKILVLAAITDCNCEVCFFLDHNPCREWRW